MADGGGAERIAAAFERAREEGRAALMPYLMGGFPDLETSRAVAHAYVESGADLIELGVPYSDPLADGPVIHAAATDALASGTTLDGVLELCAEIADRVPTLPMVYANMALARGAERFAAELADCGAAGVIVPDLPPAEERELPAALQERGIPLIPFVTPTTDPRRRSAIARDARGFIYLVSLTGVTGEREALPDELGRLIAATREEADAPVAVGFGISSADRAAEVGSIADGVIIGSRLVREAAEGSGPEDAADRVSGLLGEILSALRGAGQPS